MKVGFLVLFNLFSSEFLMFSGAVEGEHLPEMGYIYSSVIDFTQPAVTCSRLTTETLEQGVKHVQS